MKERLQISMGDFLTRVSFPETLELDSDPRSLPSLGVVDTNTGALFPGLGIPLLTLAAGEQNKSWPAVESILEKALDIGLGRDGVLVGIGGGVVCDVTAFAASIYMRGCVLILAPTTLLAMVDASLGGKTGVDFRGLKNLLGTFYPAGEIRVVLSVLRSLPEREMRSGLAEAIKTAMIGDDELFELLRRGREKILSRDAPTLKEVVRRCLLVKGRIVAEDLRETGKRAVLNLGHTFGHALESAEGLRGRSHGEAVAWGISRALRLGRRLGITDSAFAGEAESLLDLYGFDLRNPGVPQEKLLEAMRADKKRRAGSLRLVLLRRMGECLVEAVPESRAAEVF